MVDEVGTDHDGHEYLSTACWHGQHGAEGLHRHCRFICKWCDAACRCKCHGGLGTALASDEKARRSPPR
jgi:hypothetical protein